MREREARRARDKTQLRLIFQPVQFIDDAVNFIRQRIALYFDGLEEIEQSRYAMHHGALGVRDSLNDAVENLDVAAIIDEPRCVFRWQTQGNQTNRADTYTRSVYA